MSNVVATIKLGPPSEEKLKILDTLRDAIRESLDGYELEACFTVLGHLIVEVAMAAGMDSDQFVRAITEIATVTQWPSETKEPIQ